MQKYGYGSYLQNVTHKLKKNMATELTIIEWTEILQNRELTNDLDLAIFRTLYSFEEHKARASQIGLILGYKGKSPQSSLNLEIGRYAKRISEYYNIDFTLRSSQKYKFWDLFFNGWEEGRFFIWQLRQELKYALEQTDLTGEKQFAEEIPFDETEILLEGLKKTITINTFERNSTARDECINFYKPICSVCGFDFEKAYGEVGKGFIHVHHLIPISEIGETYQIDPINDLRPVCPNCHSMLHILNPPLKINELKEIMKKASR